MIRITLAIIIVLLTRALYGQDVKSISGQLLDADNKNPVAFAHIQVRDKVVVSNQSGKFVITYNALTIDETVTISCVGYKLASMTIRSVISNNTILLYPETKLLPEVVVSELTPQKIFKKAEKNGYKNYRTKLYQAKYITEQLIFYDNDSLVLAVARDSGVFVNQGLDTIGNFPQFFPVSRKVSDDFLFYDTLATALSALSDQQNHISNNSWYSFDPVNIGLLKKFHALPAIFSEGFYNSTEQRIISIVPIADIDHYLVAVYPKTQQGQEAPTGKRQENPTTKMYEDKIKELAKLTGRNLTDEAVDSIVTHGLLNNTSTSTVLGFFLVNAKDFAVSHAVIKVNTFDSSGKIFGKLHVAASYGKIDNKYYLKNLDVLVKRTAPPTASKDDYLYYYFSLSVSGIENIKNAKRVAGSIKFTEESSVPKLKLPGHPAVEKVYFVQPIKDCASCPVNPITYLNGVF